MSAIRNKMFWFLADWREEKEKNGAARGQTQDGDGPETIHSAATARQAQREDRQGCGKRRPQEKCQGWSALCLLLM